MNRRSEKYFPNIFNTTMQDKRDINDIKSLIEKEIEAIRNIPVNDSMYKALDIIIENVHGRKGRLMTSGMGKAGQIALNISTTFSSTGTPSYFIHPSEAQHGDLGMICPGDILMVISNSGKTREIIELVDLAKRMIPDIPIILITGNPDSVLTSKVDVCISTGSPKEICPLGLTPTTSTTAMTVIGDILVVLVMKAIGFDYHSYSLRHHGGYLGEQSREKTK